MNKHILSLQSLVRRFTAQDENSLVPVATSNPPRTAHQKPGHTTPESTPMNEHGVSIRNGGTGEACLARANNKFSGVARLSEAHAAHASKAHRQPIFNVRRKNK